MSISNVSSSEIQNEFCIENQLKNAMKTYFVYILLCSDNTYYTGITSNLTKRIQQHESGYYPNSYTSKKRPIELKYHCPFINIEMAIDCEKQLKKWSKAKKEALINGDFELLIELAKKKFD